jgi:Lon-like ATP-dependent protease
VLIPAENYQETFRNLEGVKVLPITRLEQVLKDALVEDPGLTNPAPVVVKADVLVAAGVQGANCH